MRARFTVWERWTDREHLPGLEFPGVYVLAISRAKLPGRLFSWRRDIVYVGMTNAATGLAGRLKQFDLTISGKRLAHGGADRMRLRHRSYRRLVGHLFVAVWSARRDLNANAAGDLRLMGRVAQLEYDCLAEYVGRFQSLPQFNDKLKAPKYSRHARAGAARLGLD